MDVAWKNTTKMNKKMQLEQIFIIIFIMSMKSVLAPHLLINVNLYRKLFVKCQVLQTEILMSPLASTSAVIPLTDHRVTEHWFHPPVATSQRQQEASKSVCVCLCVVGGSKSPQSLNHFNQIIRLWQRVHEYGNGEIE